MKGGRLALLKAFVYFTFGLAILTSIGNHLDRRAAESSSVNAIAASAYALPDAESQESLDVEVEVPAEVEAERPLPAARPVERTGSYAQVCASFDPVQRPEEIIDILEYASQVTGTPVDVLFAVWQKETGFLHGDGRMSGGCDLKTELSIRDGAAGTDHWRAMLAMADTFGWKERYGDNLERMTCSCPAKDKETGRRKGYGGCCGPFQFSGNEVAHQYAIPQKLDPMRFCDGALIAGWELKRHHDNAFRPDRNWGKNGRGGAILAANPDYSREEAAWRSAMSRYYGADTGGVYGRTAVQKWKTFHEWYLQDRTQPGYLVSKILGLHNTKYSLRRLRAQTTFASN
jgi:hypothetical protein